MQSDWKQIYKLTAKRTGKPESTYKEIGNFVFSSLYDHLRRPKSLIVKLNVVGYWYLRRIRMRIMMNLFPPDFEKNPEDFKNELSLIKHENKIEIYNLFKERLKEYDRYIELRNQIKKKRYETQPVVKGEEEGAETSKD